MQILLHCILTLYSYYLHCMLSTMLCLYWKKKLSIIPWPNFGWCYTKYIFFFLSRVIVLENLNRRKIKKKNNYMEGFISLIFGPDALSTTKTWLILMSCVKNSTEAAKGVQRKTISRQFSSFFHQLYIKKSCLCYNQCIQIDHWSYKLT